MPTIFKNLELAKKELEKPEMHGKSIATVVKDPKQLSAIEKTYPKYPESVQARLFKEKDSGHAHYPKS